MTHVGQISVDIKTGDVSGADADGPVYLGVGPREFRLAKEGNSFEANKPPDHFILGNGSLGTPNVKNPNDNDPMQSIQRIEITDVLGVVWPFPHDATNPPPIPPNAPHTVYIRYESNSKWLVQTATVRLIGGGDPFDVQFTVKNIGPSGIWLGVDYGKILYLYP
jgi:hypothetical protein